jgi:hypothetical protein
MFLVIAGSGTPLLSNTSIKRLYAFQERKEKTARFNFELFHYRDYELHLMLTAVSKVADFCNDL